MASNGLLRTEQIGFLAADPQLKQTSGDPVVSFRVLTNEFWKDKQSGEDRERVEGVFYELWGDSATALAKLMKKGGRIYVLSEQRTEQYQKDGETKYATKQIVRRWLNLDRVEKAEGGEGGEPQ